MTTMHSTNGMMKECRMEMEGEEDGVSKGGKENREVYVVDDRGSKDGSKTSFFGCVCKVTNTLLVSSIIFTDSCSPVLVPKVLGTFVQ